VTCQRSRAYARVTKTLRDLGPAKLQAAEQARIRRAADALVFCADVLTNASARAALVDLSALYDHLVESGRWSPQRAGRLLDDVWACGPGADMALPTAV
jgi:hypothetical protein